MTEIESNIIKSTKNYYLLVGESTTKDVNGELTYKIVNKTYGVVEIETNILSQAIKFLHDLEVALAAVTDMLEMDKEVRTPPIYSGKPKLVS